MSLGQPSIFVNQDGSPIQVFTEAGSIKGRPKLMRTLRNFGASLCCDPKSAEIILVDQETTEGKKFIRNWGRDKVVLHYAWAKKSIQEGKALLADCNWGECLTIDDGLPIETDSDEPEQDNPLPTPRVTPIESKVSRPARASRLSNPASDAPIKRDLSMAPPQTPMSLNDLAVTATTSNLSQAIPSISPMPINATDSFSQTPFTMQMPMMNSIQPQMTPMMMAQMSQYMMMMMNMNTSNYPYNAQTQSTDFNSALVDALRVHNMQWPSSQPPRESSMGDQTVTQLSPNLSHAYPNPSSSIFPAPDSQSTAMEAPVRKKRRASDTSSDSRDLSKSKSSKSISPAPKRLKASPPATKPSLDRKLFHSKSGKELSFFVQVEMHNRSGVVTAIKKHGGKIEGNNEIADYAILASGATKTKTFKDLLLSTVAAGRPALSARFVHDSVAQNTLLDPNDYAFEPPPTKIRKRTATGDSSDDRFDELERRRLTKNARQAARRQREREEAAQASIPPKTKNTSSSVAVASPAYSGPPSPTPPPAHTRELVGGHFKFTDPERTYAIEYVQILLARDHEISGYGIGAALHNKMPHHSIGSWRNHISSPSVRNEIDRFRKRAGIVFRKTQEEKQLHATQALPVLHQQDKSESEPENPAVTPVTPSPTLVDESDADKKMAEEDDLNAAANFFAVNEDSNDNESVVWARLTSQATCKTAGSWEEFYNIHHEEVVRRYEKLCASQ